MDFDDYEIAGSLGYICPYCKYEGHWNGDPIGGDGDEEDCQCEVCDREFIIRVAIDVDHHCYPKKDAEDVKDGVKE